ncbi:phage minor structural protein, N-terminal region [Bacillus wiedmannii]|uniref:Phage minor structural protein, N-terminal region n=1 Tax=Bacillus wiedmannii TaxID=1890302 RepID=A0A1G6JRT2_9BACI|nr:phage tail protein [Bacillus wiedmannii]SDC21368.1 phage minor structural protein, N-terminal region [Bacillus wiedmannii]
MLMVTDLTGNSEPLVGFKGFTRKRLVNGERTLSFSLFPYKENQVAFPITKEESVIEFEEEEYVIKLLKERNMGRKFYKQAEAIHKFYVDLKGKQKYEKYSGSMTFQSALDFVFEGTGYKTAVIDAFYAKSWENFGGENRLALLQKALKRYKAEMTVKGNLVTFRTQIGEDTDFQFRYNFNIKTFERIVDTTNLATYIRGYGKDGLMREYTSPNIKIFGKIDAPFVDDDRFTTVSGLDERLRNDLQDTPLISITIDFVDLRKAGYPYIVPNEGDRVFLIYEPMNINVETRIVAIEEEYDENLELIRTKVTLSNIKQDFSDAITSAIDKSLSEIIDDDGKVKYNVLDDGVKRASAAIKSAETELKFENGILAVDPKNPNNIVAFNSAGIGISRDGGQTFKEALTYEGLVASVGIVGYFSANNIKSGTIDAEDVKVINLKADDIVSGILRSRNNRFRIDLDRSGIDFYSETGKLVTQIAQAKTRQADGSSAEITYFGVSEAEGVATGLAFGKRAADGSFGNSIYIESRYGDVYMRPPTLYIIPSEKMRVEARAEFHHPVKFDASPLSKIEGAMKGEEWTIVPGEGDRGGAAIRPWTSGNGSLGTATHRWQEAWIGWINGQDIGLKFKAITDADFKAGEARRVADWASARVEEVNKIAVNAANAVSGKADASALGWQIARIDNAFARIEALERK